MSAFKEGITLRLTLAIHPQIYTIHSFNSHISIPNIVFEQPTYFIGKTPDELSVVVPEHLMLNSIEKEENWRCIEILGPLDFSMTGILSKISTLLAAVNISIFAISTFDTDYILIKKDKLPSAIATLNNHNYKVIENYC